MECPRVCFRLLRLKTIYQSSQSQESQIHRAAAQEENWAIGCLTGDPEKATALRTVKLPTA